MAKDIELLVAPLRRDRSGALRVGSTRVLVELVLQAFQDGCTPEGIVQRYPTITLAEAYAVIAYYLGHRGDLDAYMAEREAEGDRVQQRVQGAQGDLAEFRGRLLARRADGTT